MALFRGASVWRMRLVAFSVLVAAALLIDPLALYSQEPALPAPAQEAVSAVPAGAGPYRLVNVSYAPGRKLVVGTVGQALPGAVRIRVEDGEGRPVSGVTATFEMVTVPKHAEDASITPSAVSGPDGVATADLQLGTGDGSYVIAARTTEMTGSMPHISVTALTKTWWVFLVFGLVGGLGLFLYGMDLGAGGLQKVAGSKMRGVLAALTTNRFMGVVLGATITAIVQSSSATTVMVVGFVSAALMNLTQALGIIMGANIGTTLTVQLIAFQISDYALLMIGAGFIMTLVTKRKTYIYIGEIILGFGLIFYGMAVMSDAMRPLRSMPVFSDTLLSIGDRPLLGILFAAVFTGIIQSSGATIGLVVVLGGDGLIDLRAAVPIILGAHVGTCATALLASIGATTGGKRVAAAHLSFNIIGAFVIYTVLRWYVPAIVEVTNLMGSQSVPRQVANAHMFSAIIMTVLFLPFVQPWGRLVQRVVPEREEKAKAAYAPQYLNNNLLETPDLALTAAYQEILRLTGIVGKMLRNAVQAFGPKGEPVRGQLVQDQQGVESLSEELRRYYIRLSQKDIGLMQAREKHGHMSILDDLRQVAHFVGVEVVGMAQGLHEKGVVFSEQGRQELLEYQRFAMDIHAGTETAMRERDGEKARAVRKRKDDGEEHERRLREAHLARLDKGLAESVATSTAHMDLLGGMRQIGRHYFRICRILEDFLRSPS